MTDVTSLLVGLIFGSIGVGYCIYGRKQRNSIAFASGLLLITMPYFIDNNGALLVASIMAMVLPRFIKF